MSEKPRGTAVIINNPFNKNGEETRSGSGKDVDRMKKLFGNFLHFNTRCYRKGLSAEVRDYIVIMFVSDSPEIGLLLIFTFVTF